MDLSSSLKKINEASNPKYLARSLSHIFSRYIRLIAFIFVLALGGYGVYLWYGTIYRPQWSDDQTRQYIQSKGQGTSFNENGFERYVAIINGRAAESQKPLSGLTDIFRLKAAAAPAQPSAPTATAPTHTTASAPASATPAAPKAAASNSGIMPAPASSGGGNP